MAGLLFGCAASSGDLGSFYVAPGTFGFYSCEQLLEKEDLLAKDENRLVHLIVKAKEEPGGAFVSAIAYDTDLVIARGTLAELRREKLKKECQR
jgi:hypothetical protein